MVVELRDKAGCSSHPQAGAFHNLAKLVVHQVVPPYRRTFSLAVYADCNLAAPTKPRPTSFIGLRRPQPAETEFRLWLRQTSSTSPPEKPKGPASDFAFHPAGSVL